MRPVILTQCIYKFLSTETFYAMVISTELDSTGENRVCKLKPWCVLLCLDRWELVHSSRCEAGGAGEARNCVQKPIKRDSSSDPDLK